MARPKKIGLDYFPHDVDATTDPKIEPAILRFGAAAYAFYFVHLEYCYKSDDLTVDISDTETGLEMREVIQQKLHISTEDYNNILQSLLRHGAFDYEFYNQTGKLTSNGIKKRANRVFEKRKTENNRYKEDVSDPISAAETMSEMTQRKAKKRIVKQSKIYTTPLSPPKGTSANDAECEEVTEDGESLTVEKAERTPVKRSVSTTRRKKAELTTAQMALFEEFWLVWPKKVSRAQAEVTWSKINPTKEILQDILSGVERSKRYDSRFRDQQFIPHASTWLNARGWEDEFCEVSNSGTRQYHSTNSSPSADINIPKKRYGVHV